MTGAKVPDEPMYLLLNTAMSSTWGFPAPCPAGCDCDCHDCKNEKCSCAIQHGFCESLPASFLIDYVRVYQNTSDPRVSLGASARVHGFAFPRARGVEVIRAPRRRRRAPSAAAASTRRPRTVLAPAAPPRTDPRRRRGARW